MDIGLLAGGYDLLIGHISRVVTVGNIFSDCAIEEDRLLGHYTQLVAQIRHGNIAYVPLIDESSSLVYVVESLNELDACGLSTTRRTHQGDLLTLSHAQIEALENLNLSARGIAKLHLVVADASFAVPRIARYSRSVHNHRLAAEERKDGLGCRNSLLHVGSKGQGVGNGCCAQLNFEFICSARS